ncbi:AAA family ATPase [Empedobacter brevis]
MWHKLQQLEVGEVRYNKIMIMESRLTPQFKIKVIEAIKVARSNYGGSNKAFSKIIDLNEGIISNILTDKELEGKISDANYLRIGQMLNVRMNEKPWKIVRTLVYNEMEDNLAYCKDTSSSMMFVDDKGIGKTECAKHIISKMKNAFYIDCSQCKSKNAFIRTLAKTIGLEPKGKYYEILESIKYYLLILDKPLIVLDEFGDLDYNSFLEIKALQNATPKQCAWYAIGAEGLRKKMERGIENQKIGFVECFSRFGEDFIKMVPTGHENRQSFYEQLTTSVAKGQIEDSAKIRRYVNKCVKGDYSLRKLRDLIEMND